MTLVVIVDPLYIPFMKYVNPSPPDLDYERAAAWLKALAHPARLKIAAGLLEGTCCVGPMTACLDLPQPQVSRHLAVLREAGIISCEPVGRERHYRIAHPLVEALIRWLEDHKKTSAEALA